MEIVRLYQPVEFLSYEELKSKVQEAGINGTHACSKEQKTI